MYDGTTKPIKDVQIGEEIYGIKQNEKYVSYTKAVVENKWSVNKPSYKIVLKNGTELVCSGEHRWLTNRGWKYTTGDMTGENRRPYITTRNSLIGLTFQGTGQLIITDDYRKGYLSGVIKGDGTLQSYNYSGKRKYRNHDEQYQFRLAIKDIEAINRAAEYLKHFGINVNTFKFPMLDRHTKK